jgi:hypothetical protein
MRAVNRPVAAIREVGGLPDIRSARRGRVASWKKRSRVVIWVMVFGGQKPIRVIRVLDVGKTQQCAIVQSVSLRHSFLLTTPRSTKMERTSSRAAGSDRASVSRDSVDESGPWCSGASDVERDQQRRGAHVRKNTSTGGNITLANVSFFSSLPHSHPDTHTAIYSATTSYVRIHFWLFVRPNRRCSTNTPDPPLFLYNSAINHSSDSKRWCSVASSRHQEGTSRYTNSSRSPTHT